ncbi:MAG: carboxy-S-adenosyl-L-methionine synthase CmoA [Arsenophonus sp.]|nr:MAG: carboxy-S-adenosyl-L-methionine synthase CmoA [Arsenophonus sp.]
MSNNFFKKKIDNILSMPIQYLDHWKFNKKVVSVFQNMLERSVPAYKEIIKMIGILSNYYVLPYTRIYDLGCSLGTVSLLIQKNIKKKGCQIIAVDNSKSMIFFLKSFLNRVNTNIPIKVIESDICDIDIKNASMVILNFTLQFVNPLYRQMLLNKIYTNLNPGGILILSEKIDNNDILFSDLFKKMYRQFKKLNNYSTLEILQKEKMLKNILFSDSISDYKKKLFISGFRNYSVWFQFLNFCSILAIK